MRAWLTEPASLTLRCQRHCRQFRVRLLSYGRGQPLADDGLVPESRRGPAMIREVALECDGVPVIFAHTSLRTAQRGRLGSWLARLGSRSLGSLLFAFPGFRRGAIEFLRLDARHPLFCRAAALGPVGRHLWARRSAHCLDGQPVVVTEVFLPAIGRLKLAENSADKE
jgi:chorismate--pyruvate lyase